jgi:signal peptidase I
MADSVPAPKGPQKASPTPPGAVNGRPGTTATTPAASGKTKKKDDQPRDTPREIAETVVFVVVLVLMLKTFVAEAFVIPTGSMAETLFGYHRMVVCDQCGFKFPVNCASEVDPQQGHSSIPITGCYCPNCQNPIHWNPNSGPSWSSGDRVLVAKFLFDRDLLWEPKRHEVFVFKYPRFPQQGTTSMNYIKRCEGLPGETIAIFDGDLYVTRSLTYPGNPRAENPLDLWEKEYAYESDDTAVKLFAESMKRRVEGKRADGDFEMVRKPPDVMLAMRRIVFDNDHQPKDVTAAGIQRWRFDSNRAWSGDEPAAPKVFTHKAGGDGIDWMTYTHDVGFDVRQNRVDALEREPGSQKGLAESAVEHLKPREALFNTRNFTSQNGSRLIDNSMGYNSGFDWGDPRTNVNTLGAYWVSDLMLDLEVKVDSDDGEFVLELSKGIDRFRADFNVATGECTLIRLSGFKDAEREQHQQILDKKPCELKSRGRYHVRFANFDERLTVWVETGSIIKSKDLPFGDGFVYTTAAERGPFKENDLDAPAQVGARGAAVSVSHLTLWRDTFYTLMEEQNYHPREATILGQPQHLLTYYVQPGHYLALGDNSASSADSRDWGLVPNRLLLGRALLVYFPFWPFHQRFGFIE